MKYDFHDFRPHKLPKRNPKILRLCLLENLSLLLLEDSQGHRIEDLTCTSSVLAWLQAPPEISWYWSELKLVQRACPDPEDNFSISSGVSLDCNAPSHMQELANHIVHILGVAE